MSTPSLSDIAVKVVTLYGTLADWPEINHVLGQYGFQDPDGDLAVRIKELAREAIVRVKVSAI